MAINLEQADGLETLGNLPADYRHEWRVAGAVEPLSVPGGIFKWYHVHREDAAVLAEIDAEARRLITSVVESGWDMSYGLNFAMIHYSTALAFLITGIWRNHQELWERLYVYDLAACGPFTLVEPGAHDGPSACVWELGVICHERMAWHRYLFTERTHPDKQAWLTDTHAGAV